MAHYIQDYVYGQLPKKALGRTVLCSEYKMLPFPEAKHFMHFAVVNDTYYLCIKRNGKFGWVPLVFGDEFVETGSPIGGEDTEDEC